MWSNIRFCFRKEQDTHTRQLLCPSSWVNGSADTSILPAGPGTSEFPACEFPAYLLAVCSLSLHRTSAEPQNPRPYRAAHAPGAVFPRGAEVAPLRPPAGTAVLSLLFPCSLFSFSDSAQPLLIHLCITPGESSAGLWLHPSLTSSPHPCEVPHLCVPQPLSTPAPIAES